MAFTYNATLATTQDQVRFLIGDTDPGSQLLADEEIAFLLTQSTNIYSAASDACRAGAAKLARKVDSTVGGMTLNASQRYQHLLELAGTLQAKATTSAGTLGWSPVVGGYDPADDSSLHPVFDLGMLDSPSGQNPLTDANP